VQNYNIAFRQIAPESKYCKPVGADDMLLPRCLEQMVRLAEAHPTVAIVGAYGLYSQAAMGVYSRGVPYEAAVVPGRALARAYLLREEAAPAVFGAPTFTLFRSDVVRSRPAFYNESNLHADSEACLALMERHDFGFVQEILTFTRVRDQSVTSIAQDLNSALPYRLYALRAYGPRYLSPAELERELRMCLREYYRYLSWQVVKRRGRVFWRFHRDKLAAEGYPLRIGRLLVHTAGYVLDQVLNPKRTVEKAARRVGRLLRPSRA
ncbi:MAG: hypothetical protein ACREME_05635, partial [Gemmatimonadales bacterium]